MTTTSHSVVTYGSKPLFRSKLRYWAVPRHTTSTIAPAAIRSSRLAHGLCVSLSGLLPILSINVSSLLSTEIYNVSMETNIEIST